jgi:hypothetical protein
MFGNVWFDGDLNEALEYASLEVTSRLGDLASSESHSRRRGRFGELI